MRWAVVLMGIGLTLVFTALLLIGDPWALAGAVMLAAGLMLRLWTSQRG